MINTVRVKFSGQLACFTRPEFKTERQSYPVITPSAARGAIEAILWRPAIFWVVRSISVLRPIRFTGFRRNEVTDRAPAENLASKWRRGEPLTPFFADERRAQRYTLALRDVAYVIEVMPQLTAHADRGETPRKFVEMLQRRIEKGQCFHQPCLGLREFVADFGLDEGEMPIKNSIDLGRMLHDVEFGSPSRAHFFDAKLENGILQVPAPFWIAKSV